MSLHSATAACERRLSDASMRDEDLVRVDKRAEVLRLSIRAVKAALDPARRAVVDFLTPFELAAGTIFDIELVFEEIVTNVVRHAMAESPDGCIGIEARMRPDAIELRFDYGGVAFDPTRVPDPRPAASLVDAVPGGLGLMLVKRRVRTFDYTRREGRNVLTLEVPRESPKATRPTAS